MLADIHETLKAFIIGYPALSCLTFGAVMIFPVALICRYWNRAEADALEHMDRAIND